MPYEFGDLFFTSKVAATQHFQKVLTTQDRGIVSDPATVRALRDVFAKHPQADVKAGSVGISGFKIDFAPPPFGWQTCFHVVRSDGTSTDFSIKSCLTPQTAKGSVLRCLRYVVDGDILAAKKRAFEANGGAVVCPLTKMPLEWTDCHADHEQPLTFEVICLTFVTMKKLTFDEFDKQHIATIASHPLVPIRGCRVSTVPAKNCKYSIDRGSAKLQTGAQSFSQRPVDRDMFACRCEGGLVFTVAKVKRREK